MMLHEAVMLEIYRQALSASELTSPRCQSRESNTSGTAGDARCPSNESHCSANDCLTPAPTPTPNSPVGLPLPATLAPGAAAALLPPQSAAMAAYLNAAAAAAQQNHLLLTNPLAAAASLVQQAATQAHSPASNATPPNGAGGGVGVEQHDEEEEELAQPALDFSRKRRQSLNAPSDEEYEDEADEERRAAAAAVEEAEAANAGTEDGNAPLDLTVTTRKRLASGDEGLPATATARKLPRHDYKAPAPPPPTTAMPPGTWVPPLNPYLAAVAAASLSPKTHMSLGLDWNGNAAKGKSTSSSSTTNEATKALEKMTEMSRLGASTTEANATSATTHTNGRHSAWQSHWLNKGADAAKDVFKCVWCKQSFPTLATLTTHMKETQHCGVNMPPTGGAHNHATATTAGNQTSARQPSSHQGTSATGTSSASSSSSTSSASKAELNMLIKETMPLPRKLVRGQDVWLGKGAEQTRQILKCMWCGQSFRSLAEMTNHMQETQHYTNIISQEQIISWKSTDEKGGGDNRGAPNGNHATTPPAGGLSSNAAAANVNAVLTCKVCEQAFATLKELSQHMVKHNHYKEHMLRATAAQHCEASSGVSSPQPPPPSAKRGRQPREKRKKSLPVRKLLELERAQHDYKTGGGNSCLDSALKPLRDFAAATKITCEKCGSKIETALFVEHIRKCLGDSIPIPPRRPRVEPSYEQQQQQQRLASPRTPSSLSGSSTAEHGLGMHSPMLHASAAKDEKSTSTSSSTPSVLNALEQLIEKSFETRTRHQAGGSGGGGYGEPMHGTSPLGSSILKRLGIDDSSDYTKPLMDVQTMNFLRSYSAYSSTLRDRSASESSSISERCNSRIEAYTPERPTHANNADLRQATPRLTPEERLQLTHERQMAAIDASNVKLEPPEAEEVATSAQKMISVKKEFCMPELDAAEKANSSRPGSRALSLCVSERSATPKSTASTEKKLAAGGAGSSLIALSSMFDNLNNMNANNHYQESNNNNNNTITTTTTTTKKTNANPLAALQKLCDTTTETTKASTPTAANAQRSAVNASSAVAATSSSSTNNNNNNSSMVAFSWACNDGVMTADSIIKCAFCDTPFCSKGAYRHHLSKVHFLKDEPTAAASATAASVSGSGSSVGDPHSPKSLPASSSISPKRSASRSPATQQQQQLSRQQSISPAAATTPTINPYDESAQSKFLKYTELAKQLSSKNA